MLNVAPSAAGNRVIGVEDLEDLALGAAFLGTGGGGDPYIGRLMARHAIEEYGMPEIIEVDELENDATVLPAAMLGAPTVLVEKAASGADIDHSVKRLARVIGRQPDAICPIEIGGINSMIPIVAAARLGLPLVNCDGMGRAFPELQMVTFNVYGVSATPAVIVDERLDTVIVETRDGKRAEDLIRAAAIRMGLSVMISCYPMTGRDLKDHSVKGTLTLALAVGRAISRGRKEGDPIESLLACLRASEHYGYSVVLFDGKITDIRRETSGGFSTGQCELDALDGSGRRMNIVFQNENLVARTGAKIVAIVPDLICVVDRETAAPVTVEALKYGQRVKVIGTSAAPILRRPESLAVFGPQAFGLEEEFIPIEKLEGLE